MSIHNICFYGEIRKNVQTYHEILIFDKSSEIIFSSPEPKAQGELLWLVFVRRPSVSNLLKRPLHLNR